MHARALARRFGRNQALRDVTLELRSAEVVGLAGPNGAGKTTLARLVAGFLRPSAGEIRVGGLAAATFRARHGVGYLPEEVPRVWRCTPATLLALRPSVPGAPAADPGPLLERLGLASLRDVPLPRLSRGQWRLALAAFALHGPCPVVVLDEPDAGLDPAALDRLAEAVRWARRAGALVLVLSHQLTELEAVCDRILFLARGRLLTEVRTAALAPGEARALYREIVG